MRAADQVIQLADSRIKPATGVADDWITTDVAVIPDGVVLLVVARMCLTKVNNVSVGSSQRGLCLINVLCGQFFANVKFCVCSAV